MRVVVDDPGGVLAWADRAPRGPSAPQRRHQRPSPQPGGRRRQDHGRTRGRPRPSLRVIDAGSGIAPADLPHVFERFYRADPARSPDPSTGRPTGSGLGLTIARELLAANDGTVTVETTGPGGTTFRLDLPVPG